MFNNNYKVIPAFEDVKFSDSLFLVDTYSPDIANKDMMTSMIVY